jgi:hypothetical protein
VLSKVAGYAMLIALVVCVGAVLAISPFGGPGLQMPFT